MQRAVTSMMVVIAATAAHAKAGTTDTSFTYQGRLDHLGAPVDGALDMIFALYHAPTGGNPIAVNFMCALDLVRVADGLF